MRNGLWHYEHIPNRSHGLVWRVADENDDLVDAFLYEHNAAKIVNAHNAEILAERGEWRYGASALGTMRP